MSEVIAIDWSEYFGARSKYKHSMLLEKAVGQLGVVRGKALDLGAGPLVDSQYLLEQGFEVTAVETDPLAEEYQFALPPGKFRLVTTDIRTFNFESEYDLVSAQLVLGYIPEGDSGKVLDGIARATKPGGLFTAQFFGPQDRRNILGANMSFHTKEQAVDACEKRGLRILSNPIEESGPRLTSRGENEMTHYIHIIAQKR